MQKGGVNYEGKSIQKLVDEIAEGDCDLPEEKVPNTMKEFMDILIPEIRTRINLFMKTFAIR